MQHGYKEGLCIDRIDNDGNYEPNNCQWITIAENTAKANKLYCRRKPNSKKQYYAISPNGEYFVFDNASLFAKEHDLVKSGYITRVARGERVSYKNWKFGYVD